MEVATTHKVLEIKKKLGKDNDCYSNIKTLYIIGNLIYWEKPNDEEVKTFYLNSLRKFDLSDTKISDTSVQLLSQAKFLPQLQDLRLRSVPASSSSLSQIMNRSNSLQKVSLARVNNFTNDCLLAIQKDQRSTIVKLSINNTGVKEEEGRALILQEFTGLRVLRIKGLLFSSKALALLLQKLNLEDIDAPYGSRVLSLLLRNSKVRRTRNEECKDESVYVMMQAWGLCRDETYKLIAENENFARRNEIFARRNEIKFQEAELTVNAVKYVSSSQHATNIEKAVFECSGFDNDWIKVLMESSQIKDLHLSFDHTGLDKLKNNPSWKALKLKICI
jgi:hypothetical protein